MYQNCELLFGVSLLLYVTKFHRLNVNHIYIYIYPHKGLSKYSELWVLQKFNFELCPLDMPQHTEHTHMLSCIKLTCQVLNYSCHVHRSPHANAIFVRANAQIPHHAPHWEDDTCPGWTGQLGGLLLSSSGWHVCLDTVRQQPVTDTNTC